MKYCDLNYYENILFEDPDSEGSDGAHPGTGLDGGDQEGGDGQELCGQQATSAEMFSVSIRNEDQEPRMHSELGRK